MPVTLRLQNDVALPSRDDASLRGEASHMMVGLKIAIVKLDDSWLHDDGLSPKMTLHLASRYTMIF